MTETRGRITIPDVLFLLMSIAMLGALWPVFADQFQANQSVIPEGAGVLFLMVLPMAILVLFSIIYMKAIRGLRL
jgi:hypothetical protein